MNHKRLWIMAALFVLLIFPASASMVTFLVIETGLNEESAKTQYSSLWEGGLMEVFFNAGHIVTNYPVARMEKRPSRDLSGSIEHDFNEAREGGVDYFILGFLEYQISAAVPSPLSITIKLYKTDTKELIFEQTFPAGTGKSLNEEYQFAQNAGRVVVSNIKDR